MSLNSDLIKYTLSAGLAGICIGYYLSSSSSPLKSKNSLLTTKSSNLQQSTSIDLDKLLERSQFKLVPLLNKVKEKLENYPRMSTRGFVKVDSVNKADRKIRVMQWNTLARALFSDSDPNMGYKFSSTGAVSNVFDWDNFRRWRILEEILRYDSDIICLEEIDSYEEFKPFLHSIGYSSIFCPKYNSSCLIMSSHVGPDGCVIFYKQNKFQINNLHCENICINESNHAQVFVILELRHLVSGKLITVVALHLKSKVQNSERRSEQTAYILQILKRHLNTEKEIEDRSIIICGDFNGEPFEPFYNQVINDKSLKLDDSYVNCVDSESKNRLPSTFKIREPHGLISRLIDYIFYTSKSLKLTQYLKLPDLGEIEALPNLSYPSDHLSLVCDFEII